jgi:hypothetical protein
MVGPILVKMFVMILDKRLSEWAKQHGLRAKGQDALEGRLHDKECNAPALANLHVWLLLFANDLTLMSKSKVGL